MIAMESDFNNLTARQERLKAESDAELLKAQSLYQIASTPPTKPNMLLIILPIAVLAVGGIIAIVLSKKKK